MLTCPREDVWPIPREYKHRWQPYEFLNKRSRSGSASGTLIGLAAQACVVVAIHLVLPAPRPPPYRKSCYSGDRHRVALEARIANESAERDAAIDQLEDLQPGSTLAADRACNTKTFVALARDAGITPHVAQVERRKSAVDGRTTRRPGYEVSLIRKRLIEGCFGVAQRS